MCCHGRGDEETSSQKGELPSLSQLDKQGTCYLLCAYQTGERKLQGGGRAESSLNPSLLGSQNTAWIKVAS